MTGREQPHFGDPCIYCAVPHDLIAVGPCPREKIVTVNVYPPIPIRNLDWLAYFDGQEEGWKGEGPTERAAIENLMSNWEASQP